MLKDGKIWVGNTAEGQELYLLPNMANRHGLVAGATGTGKTVTLKVMAETFSDMGVPVFMADVKGDVAGLYAAGEDSADMQERIAKFKLADAGFAYQGYPVQLWDIYGQKGIPLRSTISEMGPLLLSRILQLNDLQSDILSVIFRIADDQNLLLIDTKDLKSMINYVEENAKTFAPTYGKISPASLGVITRAIVTLETAGGEQFFAEPALNVTDFLQVAAGGRGMINILDAAELVNDGRMYSTFLLWMLSELYDMLPEVGDADKPKLVFFFDEAHLLFKETSKTLLEKIEQVVKLVRSKGVGVYFCTQNPRDIPDSVLAQLGNKVQHGLRAYTPADQKAVKAAAESFRENEAFDTYDTILNLGTGEAIVSFLDEKGIPAVCEKAYILPPQSRMGALTDAERDTCIKSSMAYSRYATMVDNDSAYEFLMRKGLEDEANALKEKEAAAAAKEAEKQAKEEAKAKEKAEKEAAKQAEKEKKKKLQAAKQVGSSITGTVGREVGKQVGKNFGKFGQTLGGNIGAQLGRSILGTLFKS